MAATERSPSSGPRAGWSSDRDLPAAFDAWITERATRRARQVVRDGARSAECNAQTDVPVSDALVTQYRPDFLQRLEERADKAADRLGDEAAERLVGPRQGAPVNEAPLRYFPADFLERLNLALDAAATRIGERTAAELIGDRPTDLDGGE